MASFYWVWLDMAHSYNFKNTATHKIHITYVHANSSLCTQTWKIRTQLKSAVLCIYYACMTLPFNLQGQLLLNLKT